MNPMMVLVTYDVNTETHEGRNRLRRVAKICQNHGQRVQNSVFECLVDPAQWVEFRHQLTQVYNDEKDSLRFYFLGSNWRRRIEHQGAKPAYDPEGPLIV
jgi:CRISPR-associated protein Cas2